MKEENGKVNQPNKVDQRKNMERPKKVEQPKKADQPNKAEQPNTVVQPKKAEQAKEADPPNKADKPKKVDQPKKGRNETLRQSVMFTLLSLSAGLVETGSFVVLDLTSLSYGWAHGISVTLSVLWNFTLNRRYTFKSANNVPIAMLKVALFYVFFIPITAYFGQMASSAGINDFMIKAVTLLLNFVGEFLWWKFVVFSGSENTNSLAKKK